VSLFPSPTFWCLAYYDLRKSLVHLSISQSIVVLLVVVVGVKFYPFNQPNQITVTSAGRILESGKGKLQQEDRQEEGKSRI
jgi:hypothetical protein